MPQTTAVDPSVSRRELPLTAQNQPSVCVLCSHNCGILVDTEDGRITAVRADKTNPITHGYICNKGVTIGQYVDHKQRLTHPLRRRDDGTFETIDWDTAIKEISARLVKTRDAHSPRAIALVGVGGQGNHLDGGFALPFLQAIGTKRLFNAFAQEKTQHWLVDQWIADAPPATFLHPDIEGADYLIVLGTNPRISNRGHNATETFKGLAKDPAKTVVVVDPRETETSREAARHLRVRAGGDAWLLAGMAASIVQNELHDIEYVRDHTNGFDKLRDLLTRIDVADMAERSGVAPQDLETVAREYATADSGAIMYDLGVEQTPFSTLVSYLIRINLILTGNFARPGGDLFIEGFVPPERSDQRFDEPERALASGIAAIRALGNFGLFSPVLVPEEIMLDHPERIRALIVEGSNPYLSFSDSNAWREARGKLDLMVVIDPAFTETARDADYVLPTPTGYEKWEISLFPKKFPEIHTQVRPPILPPPGEALPEPEIYMRLAESCGIVEPAPLALRLAARLAGTSAGRALFMGLAMQLAKGSATRGFDEEAQIIYWLYRLVGPHFDSPGLVAVWGLAQQNATKRREAVLRTLGSAWNKRTSFMIGEELFRRILAHPQGVEIARLDPANNYDANVGWQDKRLRVAPAPMIAELERALETQPTTDQRYPFVLGNGLRTRWTANTIQRNPDWRRGKGPHCSLHLSATDALSLGLQNDDLVRLATPSGAVELPAEIDSKVSNGYVWFPNGFGMQWSDGIDGKVTVNGINMNEITSTTDRDPFTGCPHHRYVRCSLEKVERAAT